MIIGRIVSSRVREQRSRGDGVKSAKRGNPINSFSILVNEPLEPGQQSMLHIEFVLMGLLQLAVTWYMLEGKLPTGTSKTKKIQIYLDEVALFWMSQWAACPPACTM